MLDVITTIGGQNMAQENNIVNGNQLFIALNSITKDSMEKKKKRGIDFRFSDKQDVITIDEKKIATDEVERLETELEEKTESERRITFAFGSKWSVRLPSIRSTLTS